MRVLPVIKADLRLLASLSVKPCNHYDLSDYTKLLSFHYIADAQSTPNEDLALLMISEYPDGILYPAIIKTYTEIGTLIASLNCLTHFMEINIDKNDDYTNPSDSIDILPIPEPVYKTVLTAKAPYSVSFFKALLEVHPDFTTLEIKPGRCIYDLYPTIVQNVAVIRVNKPQNQKLYYDVSLPPYSII